MADTLTQPHVQKHWWLAYLGAWHTLNTLRDIGMKQQTLEGTWEEILLHAPQLAGQRVRLTVLTNQEEPYDNPIPLDQLLKDRVGRVQFEPSNLSERTGETLTQLLAEQHQSLEPKE